MYTFQIHIVKLEPVTINPSWWSMRQNVYQNYRGSEFDPAVLFYAEITGCPMGLFRVA